MLIVILTSFYYILKKTRQNVLTPLPHPNRPSSITIMPKEVMTNRPFPFSSDIHMTLVKIILKYTSESSPHSTFSDFKRMRKEIFIFTLIYSKIIKFEINTGTVKSRIF